MRFAIDFVPALFFAMILIGLITFLRLKKKKSFAFLSLFTIFCIYLYKVLDYTLFQFQSLLLMKRFMPNLMLNGASAEDSLNLIPLLTLGLADIKTSLLNILLFIPFGLGLPFVANFRMKKVIILAALFSLAIELAQLMTGLLAKMTFRVADINDVIFNTLGAMIGYVLFAVYVRIRTS
jgi:glycopeptide antibiotics resistance protein